MSEKMTRDEVREHLGRLEGFSTRRVARLRQHIAAVEAELDAAKKVISVARAAALEEVASKLYDLGVSATDCPAIRARIHALQSQPPAVLPAERVREALVDEMYDEDFSLTDTEEANNRALRGAAKCLGLDLDAAPAKEDTRQDCTCLGTCRGASGLGPGWKCALEKSR